MPEERVERAWSFGTPAGLVFVVLLCVYAMTLAPDLTLWDAGEFQSAVATFGVPHPPGAPLYVLIARVWTQSLPASWLPVAMNLLSATSTAVAGAVVAHLFARWMQSPSLGVAAGLAGGLVFSVWQNATETEVYALSLLLGALMLLAAESSESNGDRRGWILAYLMGMAAALHLDALLAAPAAVLLASSMPGERSIPVRQVLRWGAPGLVALGFGRGSAPLLALGVAWGIAVALLPLPGNPRDRLRRSAGDLVLVALGASGVLFMLVRAGFDPGVNQGDPSTWQRFLEVITRAQYDVPGLWPRRAPLWLQIGNVLQYLEWQFAFGLDNRTTLSIVRTPLAIAFLALAWIGGRQHWVHDRRSARAWLVYVLVGGLGAMLVLNLQAGPTIGWGILPDNAGHEARERDYFFVVAFLGVAAWAAVGAGVLARRALGRTGRMAPLAVVALLAAMNWGATDRRREPDASVPRRLGESLLASAPPNAVLLLAGDNDSYAVWQSQWVRGLRRDVVPVTLPLLGADWYRRELKRRYRLLSESAVGSWAGEGQTISDLRDGAARVGRPFATAMSVPQDLRLGLRANWTIRGLVFVLDDATTKVNAVDPVTDSLAQRLGHGPVQGRDPTTRYIELLLTCPARVVARVREPTPVKTDSLDSVCNF